MKTITRTGIGRMASNQQNTIIGGGGSSSGSGGGGGSADYAEEAGHAETADTATEATNLASDSTDWQKIMRKDIEQTAAEVITFAKGIVSTLVSKFKAGIRVGPIDQFGIDANGDTTVRDISTRTISADGNISATGDINGDDINATGDVTSQGEIEAYSDIRSTNGKMQAIQVLANAFKNPDFVAAVGLIGRGFGITIDNGGKSTLQTDDLLVLGTMIVNALNIREVTYIGGTFFLTPASSTAIKVVSLYTTISYKPDTRYWTPNGSGDVVGYRLMWLADNGTVGTMNYWKQGDQAYCHTFNVTQPGNYTNMANQNWWRLVCRVGQTTRTEGGITEKWHFADVSNIATVNLFDENDSPITGISGSTSLIGMTSGTWTTPADGDKVVMLGSQVDTSRGGAIQITAEGEASIGIYDQIYDYSELSTHEVHYLSRTAVRMNAAYFSWRVNGNLRSQADVLTDIDDTMTEVANINVNLHGINMTVGKMTITRQNGITANYDFWEQSGEHTIRNSSWESGYWTNQGSASSSSYRIRSSQAIYSFGQADGFLVYDMNGGQSMQFFEFNNNNTGQPPTYALRYTPPTQFAVPETYTVKAHILSYISDGQGGWTFDQHAEEADANSGVVFITPSKGSAVRFRIYFVATGKMIGSDPVDAITNLQPYLAQAKVSNSLIQMVSDQLKVMVNQCGLNIKNRVIELIANKVNFLMPDGSTNPLISIDPTTGALNAVDGNFEGTVRAANLFEALAVTSGDNPNDGCMNTIVLMADGSTDAYIYFWQNVTIDGVTFLAGHYYLGSYIDAQVQPASQKFWLYEQYYTDYGWRVCTGPATKIRLTTEGAADFSGRVILPCCADFTGKTIEVDYPYGVGTSDATIMQADGASVFVVGLYIYDGEIQYGTHELASVSLSRGNKKNLYSTGSRWVILND